jgi:hypothetical protein
VFVIVNFSLPKKMDVETKEVTKDTKEGYVGNIHNYKKWLNHMFQEDAKCLKKKNLIQSIHSYLSDNQFTF